MRGSKPTVLETAGLLIGPWERFGGRDDWSHAVRPGAWVRSLSGLVNGQSLGFAAWNNTASGLLSSWFGSRQITLFETDDASLLMTLRRGFWRVWEVFDSEEHPVGSIYRNALTQRGGEILAHVRKPGSASPGAFLNHHNQEMALFRSSNRGWELSFLPAAPGDPFLRMVLLGAVLAMPPEPR